MSAKTVSPTALAYSVATPPEIVWLDKAGGLRGRLIEYITKSGLPPEMKVLMTENPAVGALFLVRGGHTVAAAAFDLDTGRKRALAGVDRREKASAWVGIFVAQDTNRPNHLSLLYDEIERLTQERINRSLEVENLYVLTGQQENAALRDRGFELTPLRHGQFFLYKKKFEPVGF